MIIYIIEIIIILSLWALCKIHKIGSNVFVYSSCLVLALVCGLRSPNVGEDTLMYIKMFNFIKNSPFKNIISNGFMVPFNSIKYFGTTYTYIQKVEIGYAIIIKLCGYFMNAYIFQLSVSFITCLLIGHYILSELTDDVYISLLVFMCSGLYMHIFNIQRQMLAISLLINCHGYIKRKLYNKSLLFILLSCSIHISSICYIPILFLFLVKKNVRKKFIKLTFILSLTIEFIFSLLGRIIPFLIPRYSNYFTVNYWDKELNGEIIVLLIVILSCIHLYSKKRVLEDTYFICEVSSIVYVALELLSFKFTMVSRVSLYYMPALITLLPTFSSNFKKNSKRLVDYSLILLLIILFLNYAASPTREYSLIF